MEEQMERRPLILYETIEMLYKYINGISFHDIAEMYFPGCLSRSWTAWRESPRRFALAYKCRIVKCSAFFAGLRPTQSGTICAWRR